MTIEADITRAAAEQIREHAPHRRVRGCVMGSTDPVSESREPGSFFRTEQCEIA
ncbi:hypothetical protein ABZ379_11680 [Streptomyces canus]|uniref:hypothetical protein n=1 Tax=Streptomyces canus TaxID=58343 RepID=UPI0033F18970